MDDKRTNALRQRFGDDALLGWVAEYGTEPIYPATAITQIKKEHIVALVHAGMPHKEVADELDVCLSHVYTTWNRWRDGSLLL